MFDQFGAAEVICASSRPAPAPAMTSVVHRKAASVAKDRADQHTSEELDLNNIHSSVQPSTVQCEFQPGPDDNYIARPALEPDAILSNHKSSFPAFQYNAALHPVDTSASQAHPTITTHRASPLSAELRVQTDLWITGAKADTDTAQVHVSETSSRPRGFSSTSLPVRSPSVKSAALSAAHYTGSSLSPASGVSSPALGPLSDITPLPSPIGSISSPGLWTGMAGLSNLSPPNSTHAPTQNKSETDATSFPRSSPKKRKAYQGLISTAAAATNAPDLEQIKAANALSHARNRSLSEYVPEGGHGSRPRHVTTSGYQIPANIEVAAHQPMHREEYLAIQRGISALPTPRPPTPPRSNRSATDSSDLESPPTSPRIRKGPLPIQYEARHLRTGETRRWTAIRQLGKGTFSTVMLATTRDDFDADHVPSEEQLDPRTLVAVKICEHGPAGGADEKKIESSLKRELEILKAIHHPSLVHLKAVSVLDKRAFLVLNYAPGGDLFELANLKLDLLVPSLIRRIFAEIVHAVQYLHEQYIVHRDIKLESKCPVPATRSAPLQETNIFT